MAHKQNFSCEEAQELITGLVDNELSTEDTDSITVHFGQCNECAQSYSREFALKRLLKQTAQAMQAPRALRNSVISQARFYQRKRRFLALWQIPRRASALAYQTTTIIALLALPILIAHFWRTSSHAPIAVGIFQSYRQITNDEVVPITMHSLAELRERLRQDVDGSFSPMAYDFSAMNIHVVGGMVQEIAMRKVLVAVYKGNDRTIICYTFLGAETDAPEVAEMFVDAEKNMNFHQFSTAQINAVMHAEGAVNCVLVSDLPMPQLLQLARAKAHPFRMPS